MTEVQIPQPVGIDQIVTAGFRTTSAGDEVAQRLKDALGFGAFNIPARLAIARSLAIEESPPPALGEVGRAIKGDTLFGTGSDLGSWVSLLTEHAGRPPESLKEFQAWVAAHWTRGLSLLALTLEEASGDSSEFWRVIASSALPAGPARADGAAADDAREEAVAVAVSVGEVGEDVSSGTRVAWAINAPGGSPHAALMGGVGSGKTRTAAFMLRAIRAATPVPIIAFDFKGDMSDDRNALDRAFGARVIGPPHESVPLDVLAVADRSRTGIALAAQRLRDSIGTLKGAGFGANQKSMFGDAAENALRAKPVCQLSDILDSLRQVYADQGKKEDGAVATMADLCRFELFAPIFSPAEFFGQSWVIRLTSDLPDLVKISIVTLVTDALDRYLNSLFDAPTDEVGNRALRVLCVIDEAHRILGSKLPGLSGLIRLSRSKGGSVMLISQGPDDFSGEDDEFLNEMGLVAAFRTNADAKAVRRIFGPGANLATLEKGHAWVKMGAEPAAKRVVAWR